MLHATWTNSLHNDMVQDIVGTLIAVLAFAAFLYAPGYLAAHAADLFGFRKKNFTDRSLWSIAASFCVAPIAGHLTGRLAGLAGVCWFFALCTAGTAFLLATSKHNEWPRRDRRITALFVTGLTVATLLLLTDVQIGGKLGHKLYFSVVMADQSYRIAFTDAVARTGIPPANPLYYAGAPAPMRYFYFWYVLCAAVMKIAHVSARQAFTASTTWAAFGLLATVQLFTTHFFRWERKQRWIAIGLLAVSGADLIPALGQAILQPTLNGNTEWWSVDPIFAWGDSLLWVPHHVAGVLCCLLGFLFLWRTLEESSTPATTISASPEITDRGGDFRDLQCKPEGLRGLTSEHAVPILFAAAAFASAFGLSVYVTFGFALLMTAWVVRLWTLRHLQRVPVTRRVALTALFSALLSAPFLHELASGPAHPPANASAPTSHLFILSVRRMIDSELLTGLPVFANLHRTHPVLLDQTLRLVLLLPGLAMELGVYGAALVLLLLAHRRNPQRQGNEAHSTALFFTVCGLGMTLFLSSSVISNNDFGYRAVMLPQFFLLLLTAELLGSWQHAPWQLADHVAPLVSPTRAKRRLLNGLVGLGIAGTLYWAVLLRAWLPIEAANQHSGFSASPDDEFQIREAFATLDRLAPTDAVIAFRPIDPVPDRQGAVMVPNEYYQRMLVMDSNRQMLNAEGKCATHFGGDPAPCRSIQEATAALYAVPAPSADSARQYCARFGVQFLLLSPWDPQWEAQTGWPVALPVVAQQPRLRILQCQETGPYLPSTP